MSVTGASYNINSINKLAELELKYGLSGESSWHNQYKDSCYIFIGGLPFGLNEGDIAVVFSQWGEPVDIHLVRDKKTGTSRGFAFIGYEDQRSTTLAVDNFNGYELLGRRLRVDHCKNFRAPKPKGDAENPEEYKPSGAEGEGFGVYGVTESVKQIVGGSGQESTRPEQRVMKDAEEQWAEEFENILRKERKKEKKAKKKLLKKRSESPENDRSRSNKRRNRSVDDGDERDHYQKRDRTENERKDEKSRIYRS